MKGVIIPVAVYSASFAAPYCVVSDYSPKDCIYYSTEECLKQAEQVHGICTTNEPKQKASGLDPSLISNLAGPSQQIMTQEDMAKQREMETGTRLRIQNEQIKKKILEQAYYNSLSPEQKAEYQKQQEEDGRTQTAIVCVLLVVVSAAILVYFAGQ